MKTTNIYLTAADNSYSQCIDNINGEITAAEYIEQCRINNGEEYWAQDIGAEITAKVYADGAGPMFDEPISTTSCEIETINEEEKTMKTTNTMATNATMATDNFEGLQIAADALRQSYDRLADHAGSPAQVAIVKALNEIADIMQTAGENDYNPDEKYTPAEYAELIADLIVEYTAYIG